METPQLQTLPTPDTQPGTIPPDAHVVAALFGSLVQPFAEAQKAVAEEATKQAEIHAALAQRQSEIEADVAKNHIRIIAGVAFAIIVLAGMALFFQKDQTAQTFIMGVLGMFGGLGINNLIKKDTEKK